MSSYNATTLTLYNRKAQCNACTITGNHNQITGEGNSVQGNGNTVKGKNNKVSGYGNTLLDNGPRTWERREEECSTKRIDPWRPQATGENFGLSNVNHSVQDPWQEVKPNLDQEAKKGNLNTCFVSFVTKEPRTVCLILVHI